MKTPEIPADEADRVAALQALCILDTPPEERFDRITRLVQRLFDVPIALVSLVDADRQWFKSHQGLDATETPRNVSFCGHAILAPDAFYVPDALADERFADNPLVTGPPHVRFYMGIPLTVPGGQRVGTLCIIDHVPRTFDANQRSQLQDIAAWVVSELDHDLTRETARRLSASESYLEAVLDNVADGIITIDRRGTILTVNKATVAVFGYPAPEMVGANIRMLMPEPYHSAHDGYLAAYHTTGQAKVIGIGREVVGKRRDGTLFPFSLAVSKIGSGDGVRFVGLIRDLTEHRQLELQRKRIADIVRTSDDAILSKSVDGTITSWNPGAERLFGYTEQEALGQPILMLFPPELIGDEAEILDRIRDGHEVSHFETVRLRKDGGRVEVSVTISPITDEHGQIVGASKIARDITERKKVERLKSQFVSTVSHELRTPLTSIRGALGILSARFSDGLPAKAQRMLSMAERNSERLTLLINDILDLEKIESGQLAFEFGTMDLVEAAEQAVDTNEAYARTHGATIVLDSSMTSAMVRADPLRIAQVFANLLSNAAKFSPPEGQVELTLTRVGRRVRVGVRDHGEGVPEAFRARIFERFSQADGSNTRQKGGTGLGLSISQAIVQRHNGDIGFETEIGQGTEFYFDLPLIQPTAAVTPRAPGLPGVLICEDNADVAEILAELLDAEGVAADVVHTISDARTHLRERPYALMLLDLQLPDGDGLALIHELRADPATSGLPIVIVSGRADLRTHGATGAVEVMDWLQKPVDQTRLSAAVRRAFASSQHPRVLHVEDDLDVAQITQVALEGLAHCTSVTTRAEAEALLETDDFDLVILDLQLADGSGAPLLEALRGRCPVVIFSGLEASPDLAGEVAAALTKSRASNAELVAVIQSILTPSPES